MKKSLSAVAAILGLAIAAPASAATFSFDFFGPDLFRPGVNVTGSGVFTTSDMAVQVGGQTALPITAISGMVDGSAIVAPDGFYGNYFITGPAFLDGSGVRFNTVAANNISFFNQSSNGRYRVNIIGGGRTAFVTASSALIPAAAAVPEPATWAMMIMGFGMVGGAVRHRRQAIQAAYA